VYFSSTNYGEFENGKIKGRRDYWDLVTLREQLLGELDKNLIRESNAGKYIRQWVTFTETNSSLTAIPMLEPGIK
jgi:hypothetical protein